MRVLVVEDHPRLAQTVATVLRREGMAVDVAFDGREALSRTSLTSYDVVVLDRDLPEVHGDDVCRSLAAAGYPGAKLGQLLRSSVGRDVVRAVVRGQQISEENLHQRLALPGPRDELGKLADTIDGLLERLEGAFEAQRRFVANASHELRTPLTATRALLEMAISDPDATVVAFRETCRQALEENEQQEQLIDALLALAQGQRGIVEREPVDLAALTGRALRAHQFDAAAHGVRIEASLDEALIAADQRLIERLVSNLIERSHSTHRAAPPARQSVASALRSSRT